MSLPSAVPSGPAVLLALLLSAGCRSGKPDEGIDSGGLGAEAPDADGDGYDGDEDCDDNNSVVHPNAAEICDGVDNNCDGTADEGVTTTFFADTDRDGFGDEGAPAEACEAPPGHAAVGNDCNDADADSYPGAAERCDGLDNDCDGSVDEEGTTTFYADGDGDGFGDPGAAVEDCDPPSGYVADDTDCDDTDGSSLPGGAEVCDEADNDCDGTVDEGVTTTFYQDVDGDTYGVADITTESCDPPTGYSPTPGDCDDVDGAISPDADEVCDTLDNDCDGAVDEDSALDASSWYADADGDGFGDPATGTDACAAPSGHVDDDSDCDDSAADISPDAAEVCDGGIDNDCDGAADDADRSLDLATADAWYADDDGDGFGDAGDVAWGCEQPSGYLPDDQDCDDGDASANPDGTEVCSGTDEDCDGVIDDLGPAEIRAGALTSGQARRYQYSPVTSGAGYLEANWSAEPAADSYELAVGSTPGDDDVAGWTDVGAGTSATLAGLSLQGAWEDAAYYISVRAVNGSFACDLSATSEAVQVAEAETWTGDVADLRAPDGRGGYAEDWPQAGVDAVYGEHWFEEVSIPAGSVVRVQGWGLADGVSAGISSSDVAVTDPLDGWVALYADDITISGQITASGRGYGGGAGGGAGVRGGWQGYGGEAGLGGDGGPASAGGGGGGSPGGQGGAGAWTGGDGNLYGGGSGATSCSGSNGRDGGDGASSTVGGTGGTASSGVPGAAGVGEFAAGGGSGVSGCDNWTGGGGGGYGGGGSGGSQWVSSTAEAAGGGGGGSGGAGGGVSVHGGRGAGPYGGGGGTSTGGYTGVAGTDGGYLALAGNGDTSADRSLALGGGGGGGSGGYQETGGGGGGAGGGAILLYAWDSLTIDSTAYLLANGAGAGGGARDNGGSSTSAAGGGGAGGTIVLEARSLTLRAAWPYLSATGGGGRTTNGGTIKLFYDTLSGTTPSSSAAGRIYDAGSGSWSEP